MTMEDGMLPPTELEIESSKHGRYTADSRLTGANVRVMLLSYNNGTELLAETASNYSLAEWKTLCSKAGYRPFEVEHMIAAIAYIVRNPDRIYDVLDGIA